MNQSHCLNDDRVGPLVVGCRDNFDFTKTFEQLALSIAPNVSFIVIAATRIAKLSKASARGTLAHRLLLTKTLTALALLGLHFAYLNFLLAQNRYGGRYDVFAAALATSSTAVLALHLRLAHARMQRPSDTITIFLFVSIICEAVQLRTHWLSAAPGCLTGSLAAITTLTPVLLALELTSISAKRERSGVSEDKKSPRSAFSKVFLWWLNDLVRHAYRHDVVPDDLGPLEDELAAETYRTRFMTGYRAIQCKEASRGNTTRGWKVVRALLRALGGSCVAPVLPRIIMSVFKFAHPFFIDSILNNLSQSASYLPPGTAVAYVGIVVFLNVGTAMATSMYGYYQERAVAQVRSCLVPALYQKTVRRNVYSEKSSSVLSMMNSEMNMIQFGAKTAHEFWICLVETILGCWLLQHRIGWAFLAPLAVVLLSASASTISGRFTAKRQGAWMDALGSRVGLISSVLPNLPSIKMAGLGNQIGRVVQISREREISLGNRFRLLSTASATFAFVPMIFCPIVTFTVARKSLTMSEVMTSLAFINLLSNPMIHLLQCIPFVMAAITSIGRVEEFLDSDNDDGQVPVSYRDDVDSTDASGVIELVDASFGWDEDEWSVQNINLSMPAGSFHYIVGPVAAGKTTFCLGLLDEVKHTKGQVSVHRGKQLSYCSQDVFIINGTIRENIVGFAPFKAALYEKVVNCCQLQADFASLANGDETVVGSQGVALSGGQKKRISLARSLYAEPDVAIFDDVLSGVDSRTAESIACQVFGPEGILRNSNTTVIFSSQSTEFVDYFNKSFVLTEGIVTWSGSPAQLPAEVRSEGSLPVTKKSSQVETSKDRADIDEPRKSAGKSASGTLPMVPPGHGDDYSFYFAAVGPFTFLIFFLLAVVSTFLFTFSTLWLEIWVAAEGDSDRERFYFRTFWALQVTCLLVLLVYFTYTSNVMGPKASSKLHFGALKTIILAPLDYYTTVDSSVPTGYMSQDMNIIDSQFTNSVGNTVASTFITLFQFFLIILGSPAVLVGYPFFSIVLLQLQRVFVRAAVQLRAMALEGRNPLNKHFKETLDGLVTIRAFGWSESSIRLNDELLDKSQQSSFISAMLQTWLKTMLNLCIGVIASIFVGIASRLPTSTGLVGVALVTFMSAGEMLGNVIQSYTALQTSAVALNRLKFLQDGVPREDEPEKNVSAENWPSEGTIQLDAVSAAYKTSKKYPGKELALIEAHDPDDALKALSLSIKKGKTTLICGRTGSGKSTLLLLLQGFIIPHSGSITIDGIAPARVDRNKLRDSIIALPQFPFLLTDDYTVRDNLEHHFNPAELSLADIQQAKPLPPQDEDCIYALQTVGLWDTISARGGLDAPLKEGSLSRGQKQLFSLARAILRQRRKRRASQGTASEGGGLLLLDEFNTGLDSSTESLMWEVIKTEFACCTIICVAHRLGAASDFDHVVVLSHGRIIEEGVPSALLEDSDSKFRAIWSMKEI
ncbi:ABC transporter, transmembrane domain, type 1 [Cordyceps fumosorosea ARSEF 2679]|uniref:ABC transporter, transmembrane domain, type 1 n=1 Tax=Cordyceps fumosorosea (strain ARSEF 2679) TaxID=1081104 RepID=A0A168CKU1_CORFA|nr:ABC transporter, transmembrane domain, type 1 [Cordyceps fumosorosea ARSEF 2679]OAA71497.1 ABC transporter, transmembrane domain, type 1 [Cordyceps fumosorosea ARSEF 2679]